MLIAFIVFEVFDIWMVYVDQETVCWSRNWEDSSDFELFDIWKVINIDLNGNGTSEKTSIYLCFRYIKFDISEFI